MPLRITRKNVSALTLDPENARKHDRRNLDAIKLSLERFGQQKPIVIDPAGMVIAGNGTLEAAIELGWTKIDVVQTELTGEQARAFALADNRTGELSTWDEERLVDILHMLNETGGDELVQAAGFSTEDIEQLRQAIDARGAGHAVNDPGPGDPPVVPTTRTGDVWLLGEQRIMCGNSTLAEDMAALMGDDVAVLLATDPPYLVDYQGGNHPQSWANRPETRDAHWDDYTDPTSGLAFFVDFLRVALAHCIERVPVYQWHATRRQVMVEEAWKANGLLVHQTVIWVKSRPVLTRSFFMWQHEPCFVGWPQGHMPERDRRPVPNATSVWSIDQVGQQDGIHPTQKPLEIFLRPIEWHSRAREVVLEPFSGSGTQLIASEQLGRRCRAMELSPAFVDVAVVRWQTATGQAATLRGDGRTFAEVAAERALSTPPEVSLDGHPGMETAQSVVQP